MTTTPSISTVCNISRMASTAAWSAASLLPRPTQRAAAIAAASVTRTSSTARLRSGRSPLPFSTVIPMGSGFHNEAEERIDRADRGDLEAVAFGEADDDAAERVDLQ